MNEETKALAYDELEAAIIKAVPEIVAYTGRMPIGYGRHMQPEVSIARPITLEDVLQTIPPQFFDGPSNLDPCGRLILWFKHGDCFPWTLGHDLAWHKENAPETIRFLHSLLCSA